MKIFSYIRLFSFLLCTAISSEEIRVEKKDNHSAHAETYIYRPEEQVLGSFTFVWDEDQTFRLEQFILDANQMELGPKLWSAACEIAENLGVKSFTLEVSPEEKAFYSLMGCRPFNPKLPLLMQYKLSTPTRELCIIGCGGGGTKYTSECLQTLRLDIGHETVNTDGFIGWMFSIGPIVGKKSIHLRFDSSTSFIKYETH